MSYMTKCWEHAKERSVDLSHDERSWRLRETARPTQIAYVRIMSQYQGDPSGIEVRHHSGAERWAFVLPDASQGGMRIQLFDKFGFTGHQNYPSLTDAVEEMVRQGYRTPDVGALDLASQTALWAEGMAWMEKLHLYGTTGASKAAA